MGKLDAALKHGFEIRARDWAEYTGAPKDAAIDTVDADISTVSYAADKVFIVSGIPDAEPYC